MVGRQTQRRISYSSYNILSKNQECIRIESYVLFSSMLLSRTEGFRSTHSSLFSGLEADQHKVCELQQSDAALQVSTLCLPTIIAYVEISQALIPSPFLHIASDQNLEPGKAWEQG